MEYNIDGMAPQQPNIFKRAWQNITLPHYGRTIGFLTLLVIILAIPATITFLYKPTNLQQEASEQLPSDPNSPDGKIDIFNARGETLPATGSTSNTLQLKITAPSGSTLLGQAQKTSTLAYLPKKIIPQAYAESTSCININTEPGSTNGFTPGSVYQSKVIFNGQPAMLRLWISSNSDIGQQDPNLVSSWTQVSNDITNPQNNMQVSIRTDGFSIGRHILMMQLLDNQGNTLDEKRMGNCAFYFDIATGGAFIPTATPTPSQDRCTYVSVSPESIALNANVPVEIRHYGAATKARFWISSNSEIGKTPSQVASWTPVGIQNLTGNSALYQVSSANFGFAPGQHAVLAQLLDNNDTVLAENKMECTDMFTFVETGSGYSPTATPTPTPGSGAPANPATQIVKIDIQNLPDSDQSGSPVKTITDAVQLSRILHGTEKVGWNLALPDFTQDLTTQDKTVEVTFWYAGNRADRGADGKNYVKTTQVVRYAPFVMRFSTDDANVKPRVGQPLYVYVYGNYGVANVGLTFNGEAVIADIPFATSGANNACITKACVVSTIICDNPPANTTNCRPDPSDKVIAWKFPIPAKTIAVAAATPNHQLVATFISNKDNKNDALHATEAVNILPENIGICPSYTISGKVIKQDGSIVENATVCLDPTDGYYCSTNFTSKTDASGNYTITAPNGKEGHTVYALIQYISAGNTQGTIVKSSPIAIGKGNPCADNKTNIDLRVTHNNSL